jgi:flagellin-like hook-associated protein FlgL
MDNSEKQTDINGKNMLKGVDKPQGENSTEDSWESFDSTSDTSKNRQTLKTPFRWSTTAIKKWFSNNIGAIIVSIIAGLILLFVGRMQSQKDLIIEQGSQIDANKRDIFDNEDDIEENKEKIYELKSDVRYLNRVVDETNKPMQKDTIDRH